MPPPDSEGSSGEDLVPRRSPHAQRKEQARQREKKARQRKILQLVLLVLAIVSVLVLAVICLIRQACDKPDEKHAGNPKGRFRIKPPDPASKALSQPFTANLMVDDEAEPVLRCNNPTPEKGLSIWLPRSLFPENRESELCDHDENMVFIWLVADRAGKPGPDHPIAFGYPAGYFNNGEDTWLLAGQDALLAVFEAYTFPELGEGVAVKAAFAKYEKFSCFL